MASLEPVIFLDWSQGGSELPNDFIFREQVFPTEDDLGVIVAQQRGILLQICLVNGADQLRHVGFYDHLAGVFGENELVGQVTGEVELVWDFVELEVQLVHDLSFSEKCGSCL